MCALINARTGKHHFGALYTSRHVKPRRSAGRGHSLFAEQVKSSRLGGLCTDQSLDLGVDQSHDGAPKAGSTRSLAGQDRVSVSSRIRAVEEEATSR